MISFHFWYHHTDSFLGWVFVIVNYWMRLSTVGRIILGEVCIIFNNCSITERNDSLGNLEDCEVILEEVRSGKIFRWIFFSCQSYTFGYFVVCLSRFPCSFDWIVLSRFGLKYLVQLQLVSQVGYNFCLRPSVLCRKKVVQFTRVHAKGFTGECMKMEYVYGSKDYTKENL